MAVVLSTLCRQASEPETSPLRAGVKRVGPHACHGGWNYSWTGRLRLARRDQAWLLLRCTRQCSGRGSVLVP